MWLVPGDLSWSIISSFTLSSEVEWKEYPLAESSLRNRIKLLEAQVREPTEVARIELRLSNRHVNRWITTKPEECARVIDEINRDYAPIAEPNERCQWYLLQSVFRRELIRGKTSSKAVRDQFELFMNDDSVPLNERIAMVGTVARELYTEGDAVQADKYLSDFAQKHPEALTSQAYLHAWFYVSLLGIGDRRKAKDILVKIVPAGLGAAQLPATDPAFAMSDTYFSVLGLTDDELRRRAWLEMSKRKAGALK